MKSLRLKLFSIIALAVVFAISLGLCLGGILTANADRSVTISGTSIFYTTGGAKVWSHEVEAEGEGDNSYYTMFVLSSDNDAINYRRNLAYNWFYDANYGNTDGSSENEEEETKLPLSPAEGWFNMQIGFEPNEEGKLDFTKYVLTFEGQEFSQTKEGKCVNYIVFYATESGDGVNVVVTDDLDAPLPSNPVTLNYEKIFIDFSESAVGGEYKVTVANENGANAVEGKFVNVGKTYAKYSSSSTTPVTPITYSAEFKEGATDVTAKLVMYSLNGQDFKLTNTPSFTDGHYVSGSVNDVTPPVLCLDKGVSFIELGDEISFNYTVIDVLAQSSILETHYFMLTKGQADGSAEGFEPETYSETLFRKVADSDDQKMIPHVNHYQPTEGNFPQGSKFGTDLDVKAAVKVCLQLTDVSTNGATSYVMLDWFVDEEYLVKVNGHNYIAVATDTQGVSYTYADNANKESNLGENTAWAETVKEYQEAVNEAAKDLLAGSKNYFYLPSAESLFTDNATKYADMTFSIYYNNGSQQSQTNKAANALSININKPGRYVFTVYAADASGNDMYYYDADNELKEFKTSDIWSMYEEDEDTDFADTRKYLPWFYFDVEASEISIDSPEEQDIAYVGTSYTPDSFDINGVSYKTTYSLYRFNNDAYAEDHEGVALTYEKFMELKDELLKDATNRKYFTYIYASSELTEGTEEYELYNEYAWNNSSPSFVPQDENTFYLIVCTATSTAGGTQTATSYMGIAAARKVAPLKGEDTWVQDNMVSIVLLSIAGVSFIGIVLILVIKPKEKGDLDDIEVISSKKKNK